MSDPDFPYLEAHQELSFPSAEDATAEGIVAAGGNLSPGMILSAYRQGIFPWFSEDDPILWWSPDPRCVLFTGKLHVSRSMSRVLRHRVFRFTLDQYFSGVIRSCASVPRPGQRGTWITGDMIEAYTKLYELGYAHSIEVWQDTTLVGGLYGLSLGGMFFGESMFSRATNASKAAFIVLARLLEAEGFDCLDCQLPTSHLASLGAEVIPRKEYLAFLKGSLNRKNITGSWDFLLTNHPGCVG
ncbi:MAG: leucyl/phenylalanyl-tRNA--protein transferase [Spirochaetales bacterium]|nr:leucyl/phenylalanyl-tRNA--protein transferase [Spirochaetales bacterium]